MTRHYRKNRHNRRGLSTVEWFVVLGFGALAVIWLVGSLGSAVGTDMSGTADWIGEVGDGSPDSSTATSSGNRGGPKGNNGVGNGEDPQPPGNPPINDGPGTSPGNPGAKGGVKRGAR